MHFNSPEDPLSFEELWQGAGIPKTLAQNWTNGRPLRLQPYLSRGEGKGSRNVYAVVDAYVLAFLFLLKSKGLSTNALFTLVSLLNKDKYHRLHSLMSESGWATLTVGGDQLSIGPLPKGFKAKNQQKLPDLDDSESAMMQVFVNTKTLRTDVDHRLESVASAKREHA